MMKIYTNVAQVAAVVMEDCQVGCWMMEEKRDI